MPLVGFDSVMAQKWQINFYFNLYRDSLSSQEELADQAIKNWMEKIDEEAKQYDQESQAEFFEFQSEEYNSREYSKTLIMNSFFVGAYALYEHRRNRIKQRYSLNKQQLATSQLVNAPEFVEVERYRVVRNRIMHHGGTIADCGEDKKYAEKKGIVANYFPEGTYALTRQFCDDALDNFEQCLMKAVIEFANEGQRAKKNDA